MDVVKVVGIVFLSLFLIFTGVGVHFAVWTYDITHFFAFVAGVLMLVSVGKCVSCHHEK
ncbi:MAG: hypothetical protein WCF65_08405 [Parachlamydiaceae bacterium]